MALFEDQMIYIYLENQLEKTMIAKKWEFNELSRYKIHTCQVSGI